MSSTQRSSGDLRPGAVLSYSAGTSSIDPRGYRVLGGGQAIMSTLVARWPEIAKQVSLRTPLVINAYPATLGRMDFAVLVDSYLSERTVARAWRLAGLERMPVILVAQPLFMGQLAQILAACEGPHPPAALLLSGGHGMPQGLEQFIRDRLARVTGWARVVHAHGIAELDAGCLLGIDREPGGAVLHYKRDDVLVAHGDGRLRLALRRADGVTEWHDTGDLVETRPDGAFVIATPHRLSPSIAAELASWGDDEWQRRTGYLARPDALVFQLREGAAPVDPRELDFHAFCDHHGMRWLEKPRWNV